MSTDVLVTLVKKGASTRDEHGNAVYPETETTIYGKQRSVKQTEFFQAAAVGFKPDLMIEVYAFEYNGEELCEIDGNRYTIYRTYQIPNTDRIELYLTAIVGDTDVYT